MSAKIEDWRGEYYVLLDDCEDRESGMSKWEREFVTSLRERLDKYRELTERQVEVLEGLWEKVTSQG